MGYDLHITRAESWEDSGAEDMLISEEEWRAFADAHIGELDAIAAGFFWFEGRVVVRGARREDADRLVGLAAALGARLVGDEGEVNEPGAFRSWEGAATSRDGSRGRLRRLFGRFGAG
ncbi:hypothetical protein [Spongiactinospora sp. 9N601]|uniref:hypothetical protein n=1 Tax=Spongiactinospora sp. 9N601 TaxID=3375149 RepID=UPI0037B14297